MFSMNFIFNISIRSDSCLFYRFSDRGRIFSKQEIRAIQMGPGGLFFTGDGTGELKVWQWVEAAQT
jgi:hypothetical protein